MHEIATNCKKSFDNNPAMPETLAPNTFRIPISFVLRSAVYAANPNIFLAMLRPDKEKSALNNNNVEPAFPNAEIGFLDSIPAIGTKFQAAKVMGPQSQINHANGKEIRRTLWFDFVH